MTEAEDLHRQRVDEAAEEQYRESYPVRAAVADEGRWLLKHIVAIVVGSIITGTGTLVASWVLLAQNMFEEIRGLEVQINELKVENEILRIRLDGQADVSPRSTVAAMLDAISRPAWCNIYDPDRDVFVMDHINPDYERAYRVTQERYEGRTHAEIHGPELGSIYERNDRITFRSKAFMEVIEPVNMDGVDKMARFWKFYVRTRTNEDLVCGIQMNAVSEGVE